MAFGRSPRMDNRRPSSFCSTATLVVFVALCLVGVWMMTSTTVAPVEMSTPDNKSEVKDQASEGNSRTFEDTSGDLPDDTKRRDANNNANTLPDDSNSEPEKTTESITEKAQEEDPAKSNEEMNDADDMSKKNKFNDAKGNVEGRESNKDNGDPQAEGGGENSEGGAANPQGGGANPEGGDANSGSRTSDQENTQNNPDETGNNEQEKNSLKNSDETTSNEQDKKPEEIPKDSGNEKQEQSDGSKNSEQDAKSDNEQGQIEDKAGANKDTEVEQSSSEKNSGNQTVDQVASEVFPNGAQSELLNETSTQNVSWSTQAAESRNEKEVQSSSSTGYSWKLCNTTAGTDYIPCLDNVAALKKLHSTLHYEHRERHCPEENPSCLVPLPDGYKRPIEWPNSRDKIWYHNVPHTKLAEIKGHQNWVKVSGEYLTFPGGGTQFIHGALHYIDFIQEVHF